MAATSGSNLLTSSSHRYVFLSSSPPPCSLSNFLLSEQAGSIQTALKGAGDALTAAQKSVNIETYKGYVTMAGFAVMGLLAGFIFIFTFLVCRSSIACCLHGVASIVTIPLATILMVIAGLFYAVGVIGADICFDPFVTLQTLIAQQGLTGIAGDTMTYYLTCGSTPTTPIIGAPALIATAQATVQSAAAQATSLLKQAYDPNASPSLAQLRTAAPGILLDYLPDLVASMNYQVAAIGSVGQSLGCANVDGILSTLFTGLCTDGFGTIIGISRILIAASVLLFIQLGIGIDMCCFHPGITSRYVADDEADAAASEGDIELASVGAGKAKGSASVAATGHGSKV